MLTAVLAILTCATATAADRLANSATVMKEILGMPDSIPKDLLDRAECAAQLFSVRC